MELEGGEIGERDVFRASGNRSAFVAWCMTMLRWEVNVVKVSEELCYCIC